MFTPSRSFIGSRSTLSQLPPLAIVNSRRSTPLSALLRQGKARDFGELSQVHSHAMVDLSSVRRLHYLHNHVIKNIGVG
ncbi:hypothetical protein ACP70R_003284 [Stipagrostis hirtigluma subsp. patula]